MTGRTIEVSKDWNSKDGIFHVGIKKLYDLFPKPLIVLLFLKKSRKD
jgi:hypothetical protein